MKYATLTVILGLVVLGSGCASTGSAITPRSASPVLGSLSPAAAVQLGNMLAATAPAYVMFVDEKPAHCDGALCWQIVNTHRNPVLMTINGQLAQVVGPMGPLLPPGSRGYIRLVNPGDVEVAYNLYDSMRLGDNGVEMPLATVISQCRVAATIGGASDAHWGGHTTYLSSSFCRG